MSMPKRPTQFPPMYKDLAEKAWRERVEVRMECESPRQAAAMRASWWGFGKACMATKGVQEGVNWLEIGTWVDGMYFRVEGSDLVMVPRMAAPFNVIAAKALEKVNRGQTKEVEKGPVTAGYSNEFLEMAFKNPESDVNVGKTEEEIEEAWQEYLRTGKLPKGKEDEQKAT